MAAAALRAVGGQMQGRLVTDSDEQKERARKMGVTDFDKKFDLSEMASDDVILSVTGVTSGSLVDGVRQEGENVWTDTMVLRAPSGTVRWIKSCHSKLDKFNRD